MKLIFEKSVPGRRCTILPSCDVETAALPESLRRSDKPDLPAQRDGHLPPLYGAVPPGPRRQLRVLSPGLLHHEV